MKKLPALNVTMAAAFLMLSTNACSFFGPKTDEINIKSNLEDVEVMVNNMPVTASSSGGWKDGATVTVDRNKRVNILVSKEGYKDERKKIDYTLSTYGILDIVGGVVILVPALGLLSPGAYEHESHDVYFKMSKLEKSEDD